MAERYRLSRLLDPEVIRAEAVAGGWRRGAICATDLMDEHDVPEGPAPPAPSRPPTWHELAMLDTRLLELARDALSADHGGRTFCQMRAWYGRGGFKARLSALVGWGAADYAPTILRTSAAYDAVDETLLDGLPPCRGCGCDG